MRHDTLLRTAGAALLGLALAAPVQAAAPPRPAAFSEDAEMLGRLAVGMLGSAAGHAHACGLNEVATRIVRDARDWVLLHAVPIEPETTSWNAEFDGAVQSGIRDAARAGCRAERWVELAQGAAEIGRQMPRREAGGTQLAAHVAGE